MQLTASCNQELRLYTYEWANTIMVRDNDKWIKSDSGWMRKAYEQMIKISEKGGTQAEIDRAIGNEMDKYFYEKKKALVITHGRNWGKLSDHEKKYALLIIDRGDYMRVNYNPNIALCFPPNSNFHRKFNKNDFRHFWTYGTFVKKENSYGKGLSALDLPYTTLYAYTLNNYSYTFKLNDKKAYTLSPGLDYIKLPMNMRNRAAGQRVFILKEEPIKRI